MVSGAELRRRRPARRQPPDKTPLVRRHWCLHSQLLGLFIPLYGLSPGPQLPHLSKEEVAEAISKCTDVLTCNF